MAYYSSGARGWTPVAYVDGSTLTDNTHHSLRAASAGSIGRLKEVFISGEAVTNTPQRMAVRRHSTASGGGSGADGQYLNTVSDPVPRVVGLKAAATDPILVASPSDLLNVSFNAFGGLVRWLAGVDEEIVVVQGPDPNQEVSLTSISGTGIISDHFIYESL